MPNDTQSYNIASVRDLLLAAFTADDLRRLMLYTSKPVLRPLVDELSPDDGLATMIEKGITYCRKRDCLGDLLAEVKKANPQQYKRFESQLLSGGETACADSTPIAAPPPPSGGEKYVINIGYGQDIAIGNGAQVIHSPQRDAGDGVDEQDQ